MNLILTIVSPFIVLLSFLGILYSVVGMGFPKFCAQIEHKLRSSVGKAKTNFPLMDNRTLLYIRMRNLFLALVSAIIIQLCIDFTETIIRSKS